MLYIRRLVSIPWVSRARLCSFARWYGYPRACCRPLFLFRPSSFPVNFVPSRHLFTSWEQQSYLVRFRDDEYERGHVPSSICSVGSYYFCIFFGTFQMTCWDVGKAQAAQIQKKLRSSSPPFPGSLSRRSGASFFFILTSTHVCLEVTSGCRGVCEKSRFSVRTHSGHVLLCAAVTRRCVEDTKDAGGELMGREIWQTPRALLTGL